MDLKKSYERFLYRRNPVKELKKMGLKVGKNFAMMPGCHLDMGHVFHISIGDNVTLAPNVTILAHDASTAKHLNATRIGKVNIGNKVFIGAGTIILPGVNIGDNVIIGAGSVVSKDLMSDSVYAGNPVKHVYQMSEFLKKRRDEMRVSPRFTSDWKHDFGRGINDDIRAEMNRKIDRFGYVG